MFWIANFTGTNVLDSEIVFICSHEQAEQNLMGTRSCEFSGDT